MTTPSRPTVRAAEVEQMEAVAGFHAGQEARATGYHPEAMRALGGYGKTTRINDELELQVQLCLMEHTKLYQSADAPQTQFDTLYGLKQLTRLAYCFSDPEAAFETLTQPDEADDKRRFFDRESFALARHFQSAEEIDLLTRHIEKEMGLLEAANPPLPKAAEKKRARAKPVNSRR